MVLLFSHNIRSKGVYLYANKEEGILNLRRFYDLLREIYQLQYKKVFHEPVNHMFSFLENLPRSEERRVGKEGRSGWGPYHQERKEVDQELGGSMTASRE